MFISSHYKYFPPRYQKKMMGSHTRSAIVVIAGRVFLPSFSS